jgi:hypothetical protein
METPPFLNRYSRRNAKTGKAAINKLRQAGAPSGNNYECEVFL